MKEVEAMEKLDKHERIVQYIRHDMISDHSMCFLISYSVIKYQDFEKKNLTLNLKHKLIAIIFNYFY